MIGVPQLQSRFLVKYSKLNNMHVLSVQQRTNTFIDTADHSYVLVKPLMEHDTVCLVLITDVLPSFARGAQDPTKLV